MEVALTKMSSRGEVVIPTEMRKDIDEGDKLLIIKSKGQIIMKKATDLDKTLKEDLEFARRTEEAWKRYDQGKFKSMPFDEFIEELEKC